MQHFIKQIYVTTSQKYVANSETSHQISAYYFKLVS